MDIMNISFETILRWMLLDLLDYKSKLFLAWGSQTESHYLNTWTNAGENLWWHNASLDHSVF